MDNLAPNWPAKTCKSDQRQVQSFEQPPRRIKSIPISLFCMKDGYIIVNVRTATNWCAVTMV